MWYVVVLMEHKHVPKCVRKAIVVVLLRIRTSMTIVLQKTRLVEKFYLQ